MSAEEPFNFSWAIPGLLAGSGFPKRESHLKFLQEAGVDHLVTLNAERTPPVDAYRERGPRERELYWTRLSIIDFANPTTEQINEVMGVIENSRALGKKVCVHCTMGRGRTGTMIACWFVLSEGLDGLEAIRKTRELRPGSIETNGQEQTIIDFANASKS